VVEASSFLFSFVEKEEFLKVFDTPAAWFVYSVCTYMENIRKNHVITRGSSAGASIKPSGYATGQDFNKFIINVFIIVLVLSKKKKRKKSKS